MISFVISLVVRSVTVNFHDQILKLFHSFALVMPPLEAMPGSCSVVCTLFRLTFVHQSF
jgi:hypothetical protein